jgi:DNA-binding response OmpR family regulator
MARVLIVEDEPDLLELWTEELNQSGNPAVGLSDGLQVDEMLQQQSFDIVLLDAGLPGRSGLQVLQDIRRNDTRLPVVIITASVSPQVTRALVEAGASDIIFKPLPLEELLDIVTRMAR